MALDRSKIYNYEFLKSGLIKCLALNQKMSKTSNGLSTLNLVRTYIFPSCDNAKFLVMLSQVVSDLVKISVSVPYAWPMQKNQIKGCTSFYLYKFFSNLREVLKIDGWIQVFFKN